MTAHSTLSKKNREATFRGAGLVWITSGVFGRFALSKVREKGYRVGCSGKEHLRSREGLFRLTRSMARM